MQRWQCNILLGVFLTQRPGALSSMQVYALTTALCVSSAKSTKRSSSRERDGRDEDAPAADTMVTDDGVDPRDDGPSFGRLVVDGCCHAFAEALRKVWIHNFLSMW